MRLFHITKIHIQKFRSLKNIVLKNLGDVTILVGPNESGKSNILRALSWFGTGDGLSEEDKTINERISNEDDIVTVYFKVLDVEKFSESLAREINRKLKDVLDVELLKKEVSEVFGNVSEIYL